jgi:hypothetical protein
VRADGSALQGRVAIRRPALARTATIRVPVRHARLATVSRPATHDRNSSDHEVTSWFSCVPRVLACPRGRPTSASGLAWAYDGQLNLLHGGHAELPGSGRRDYFVRLLSMAETRTYPPICAAQTASPLAPVRCHIGVICVLPRARSVRLISAWS